MCDVLIQKGTWKRYMRLICQLDVEVYVIIRFLIYDNGSVWFEKVNYS